MKLAMLVFVMIISFMAKSQEIPPDILEKLENNSPIGSKQPEAISINSPMIKKGTITYLDGSRSSFKKLQFTKDSVTFFDSLSVSTVSPINEILSITKFRNPVLSGLTTGFMAGLGVGGVVGPLLFPENGFFNTLLSLVSDDEEGPEISDRAVKVIIGSTLTGVIAGLIVGATSDKEKVIYQKELPVVIFPEVITIPGPNSGMIMCLRFNIPIPSR